MEENRWPIGSTESLPDQDNISGSPSSQGSSQRRVVEILSNDVDGNVDTNRGSNNNWTLRPEFFNEDLLGFNSGNIPGELMSDFEDDDIEEEDEEINENNNNHNNEEQEDGGSFGVFRIDDWVEPPHQDQRRMSGVSEATSQSQQRPVVEVINTSETNSNQGNGCNNNSRNSNNIDTNNSNNDGDAQMDDDDDANNVDEDDDENDADYVAEIDEVEDVDDDDDLEDYESEDGDLIRDLDEIEGFVVARADATSDEEDNNEEGNAANQEYDRAVPARHRYLGEELEESRGRQVMVENSVIRLPLINMKNNIIFPGQTIPLAGMQFRVQRALRECIHTNNRTVGCISHPDKNPIGVTAEIRNYHVPQNGDDYDGEDADNAHDTGMRLILEGRQRFRLLSPPFETTIQGDVRILPEISLGRPFRPLPSLSRFFTSSEVPSKFIIWKHPAWLSKQFEARSVMKQIMNHIKDWNKSDLSQDPCEFSYWVASNLPLSNQERRKVLSFCAAELRLKWILELLNKSELLVCYGCDTKICHKNDIFSMSQTGPQNNFVNAHGYNHDTLTVRGPCSSLILASGWSSEYSWFPPYKWRMAYCGQCSRHIGWCYKHPDPNVKPKRFFGLSRANVRLFMEQVPDVEMPLLEALQDLHSLAELRQH